MKSVNLEEELIKNKRLSLSKQDQLVLDEIEKMPVSEEDIKVFSKLGMDETFDRHKEIKRKTELFDKYPSERVFSDADIKDLCVKYRLRFLSSHYYKGTLCPQLPSKIREFESKYKESLNNGNCFIVAPSSSFKLEKKPKDPLFFVKINTDKDTGENHYYLLHKWGNDISLKRKIFAFPLRTPLTFGIFVSLIGITIGTIIYTSVDNALAVPCFVIPAVMGAFISGMISHENNLCSSDIWDSHYID